MNDMHTFQHHTMAIFGGFIGGYAVLVRLNVFANAQTGNLIALTTAFFGKNYMEFMERSLALLAYISGTLLFVLLKNKTNANIRQTALLFDVALIVAEWLIPGTATPIIATLPIFFAMPFQWNAFPGNDKYNAATIFSSNNINQASLSLGEYLSTHDKGYLEKHIFFVGTIFCFCMGVTLSFFTNERLKGNCIWVGLIILAFAEFLLVLEKNKGK